MILNKVSKLQVLDLFSTLRLGASLEDFTADFVLKGYFQCQIAISGIFFG